jgi:hypothetical protein
MRAPLHPPLVRIALAGAALLLLAGCAYDYLQRTDRVGFSAGNAVHGNIEGQTVNPTDAARYKTRDLGRDGRVVPEPTTTTPAP